MNTEDITSLLEASHQRGRRQTAPEVDRLLRCTVDRRWSRRLNRTYILMGLLVILAATQVAVACVPEPRYSAYHSTQPDAAADCRLIQYLLTHQ